MMTLAGHLSERRSRTVDSILTAAMLIVAEDGIAGLSMSTLAARAGVSRQTLYNYFADVDAVLAGLVQMGDAGTGALADRLAAEPDVRVALAHFVFEAVDGARSGHPSPGTIAAALPEGLRAVMRAHEARAEALVVDLLRRGVENGDFRADLDVELDGRIVYRAAFAGAELARDATMRPRQLAERLTADLLRIVEAPPERAAG